MCPVSHGSLTPKVGSFGSFSILSRREGHYIFAIRIPACLNPFIARVQFAFAGNCELPNGSYPGRRALRPGDPRHALVELWPRLQALEPVKDGYFERSAFQAIAFELQFLVRRSGAKPDDIVAGWDDHFVMLLRETARAGVRIKKNNSLEGASNAIGRSCFAQGGQSHRASRWRSASPIQPGNGCCSIQCGHAAGRQS
jgi:hypothetical protein